MSVGTASTPACPASRSSASTAARPSALMSTRATCQPFSASIRAVDPADPGRAAGSGDDGGASLGQARGPVGMAGGRHRFAPFSPVDHATSVRSWSRMSRI